MNIGVALSIRDKVEKCTREKFNEVIDSPQVSEVCRQIADACELHREGKLPSDEFDSLKARMKKRLPILTPHATFKNGRRVNSEAVPSGFSMYDLDHIVNPRERWEQIAPRKEELGILLAHVTPSTEGLRLVFRIPQGMDLAAAQSWLAAQIGDSSYDVCVKDLARSSFVVPRSYILYVADELFEALPVIQQSSVILNETERSEESGPTPDGSLRSRFFTDVQNDNREGESESHPVIQHPSVILNEAERSEESGPTPEEDSLRSRFFTDVQNNNEKQENKKELCGTPCNSVVPKNEYPSTYEDIDYKTLVEVLEEQMGGTPTHGSRNNFIFSMACHLRYVCNDDPQWIAQILPNYGEAEDKWMTTIRSACARNQAKTMPRIIQRTLVIAKERLGLVSDVVGAQLPPEMPKKLPPLIKLLVSKTPKVYQPAVAHAVFPALAAHLWKTTFRYIDNVEHEATLMNVLMAGTGAGKNCINEPINRIMADIRERDKVNLLREKEWKHEMQSKGANKDKRQRPKGLIIQEIDPDMTNAAFVQRLADAEERFLYTKMNEIDQFDALKTSARSKAHFQIMCLAFDPGNVYGQTRVGTGSVSERVCIRFNWNASTTIGKGKNYFNGVLTDGPISRVNFCTIPKRTIGSEMPIFGTYDAAFDEELRPYIDHLNKVRGLVECKAVSRLSKKLVEECAEFSRLSQSSVYENLSFRANVIAFLKAMVLYVAHGEKWDKTMEEFIRWSLEYDMWCKMQFFGKSIGYAEEKDKDTFKTRGPQNLLNQLPDVFTREEAQTLRYNQGIESGDVRSMLSNWKKRGYIEEYGEVMPRNLASRQRYIKTKSYLEKHAQAS